jgi:ATP-dependent DNA helicase RecG
MRTVPTTESLTVEFKSDERGLSDDDLVLAVVCLANTEGGRLYVGVEDDGRLTGLHPKHQDATTLAALIGNRTVPPLGVRVNLLREEGVLVAEVEVPKSTRPVASLKGTLQRRRLRGDGKPECVPLYPHELPSRQSDLGLLDYSALPVQGATLADLDPLERTRLRQAIERYRGDTTLLGLDDAELDGALGLTERQGDTRVPTVTGLLLLGTEAALRQHLPTHEVAFQVRDDTEVRVNDFYRGPLLRTFERIEEQFSARLVEREVQVGLFRVPIPDIDRRAFREALVNAVTHRDWARLGAVHVRWETDGLVVSNPGGLVEGVTLDNLLVTEPRPRNPRLADAFKRIGLAERTGRGVDLIYKGLLRFGRPSPSYQRTTATSVVVELSNAAADLPFLGLILEEERRRGASLPLDALLVLSHLRVERRLDLGALATALQRDPAQARAAIERLVEAGLVQADGKTRGRTYTLSPRVYREIGQAAESVRQAGFDAIQQVEMVRRYVREHGEIRRKEVMSLCRLTASQATHLLRRMCAEGILEPHGTRKGAYYTAGSHI